MKQSNLRNPANPTLNEEAHVFGLSGFPTVSFQIDGSISAGDYTPQVSNDGQAWYDILALNTGGALLSSIVQAGIYRADVNGYEVFRLLASEDLNANCSIISIASSEPLSLSNP